MKKRPQTAAEFLAELHSDPEWVYQEVLRDQEFARRLAESRRTQIPLIEDLAVLGLKVQSVWDLVNTSMPYPQAVPILLEHLERDYPDRIREGIARALAVPHTKPAWEKIATLYQQADNDKDVGLKDGLACILSVIVDEGRLPEYGAFIENRANGPSRALLLPGLLNFRENKVSEILARVEQDPQIEQGVQQVRKTFSRRKRK